MAHLTSITPDEDLPSISPFAEHETTSTVSRMTPGERGERRAAIQAVQAGRSMIYAAELQGDIVKIGCTRNVYARMSTLQGELLAFQFGSYEDEQALHRDLRPHLAHGREYYYRTGRVMAVVNGMRSDYGLPALAA